MIDEQDIAFALMVILGTIIALVLIEYYSALSELETVREILIGK